MRKFELNPVTKLVVIKYFRLFNFAKKNAEFYSYCYKNLRSKVPCYFDKILSMRTAISKEFIEQSIYRIEENTKRITKCLLEIDDTEFCKIPNEHSNSIANLVLHLCGNIRQYVISALGELSDVRERAKEFSATSVQTKSELLDKLHATIAEATSIIKAMDDARLLKIYSVQGFTLSGIGIIIHVTEHYSYHTGQIAFWTKQLKNKDLQFYENIDLNVKNSNTDFIN